MKLRFAMLAVALIIPAFAGGFWITFGNPEASPEAKSKNAALIVKPTGCHNPQQALVTGTAEGLVNGKRQSIALKLIPLSDPGTYVVQKTWPSEGTWVLSFTAAEGESRTGAIAVASNVGFTRKGAQFMPHAPTKDEVEAAISNASKNVS
jgi:hypothetical protein